MFEDIQRHLKHTAREEDIKNFNLLRLGEISMEECRDRFVKTNKIPKNVLITTIEFEQWLKSEGWLYGIDA